MAIDTSKTIAAEAGGEPLPVAGHAATCGPLISATPAAKCSRRLPVDYFTFFGMPRKLNLDVARLEREFYELSRKLHPDLNARADKREQEWSLEQSSLLNDAYRTLKDPIKRTQYLLRLEGVELEEQSKSGHREGAGHGRSEEAGRASRSAGRSFRAEHAAGRSCACNKKMGEDDPALIEGIWKHRRLELEEKYEALLG